MEVSVNQSWNSLVKTSLGRLVLILFDYITQVEEDNPLS